MRIKLTRNQRKFLLTLRMKKFPIFEEDEVHENSTTNHEEEGPSYPIQSVVIPTTRRMQNWLKVALEDTQG